MSFVLNRENLISQVLSVLQYKLFTLTTPINLVKKYLGYIRLYVIA